MESRQEHLAELRFTHQRRLQALELQAARLGLSSPPHILTEIKDIREQIASIDRQLAEFEQTTPERKNAIMSLHADVLIVTVTEAESKAVVEIFQEATENTPIPMPIGDRIYHNLGTINGTRVFMVQSEMGAGGLGASQQTVQKGIMALSPAAVIMVGIAFGVNAEKQSIGDILVSQRLLLYELQRVGTQKSKLGIVLRGDRPHASPWLFNRFQSAQLYWDESRAKVRFGLILSGEKLIDNIDFRQQLLQFEPEAIGGEMEGAGLYVACQDSKVDWILVKAICDWADGYKGQDKDQRQQLAARNAASFVLRMLQHAPFKREGERRELIAPTNSMGSIQHLKLSNDVLGKSPLTLYFHRNPPYNAAKMLYTGPEIAKDLEVKLVYKDVNGDEQIKLVTDFFPEEDPKMMWHHYKYDFLKPNQVAYFHLLKKKSTLDGKTKVAVRFLGAQSGRTVQIENEFDLEDF